MAEWIFSVTDLNEYVSNTLKADPVLRAVKLRGEIGTLKRASSGHLYFTLKDTGSAISCAMWRTDAMKLSMKVQDGMSVIVTGRIELYAPQGKYQMIVTGMRPDGVGTLYQQFELLKAKLQAEGLFDQERKRSLPFRPRKIAVVTSAAGAVLHDIRNVAALRDPGVPIVLLPVPVQGPEAAEYIAGAVHKAGTLPNVDVIIVGRGGGSMEDLWCFNEETVARAIAASPIPVISAVGHETDFTIADFVADVRASTPSHAAEMAVPDRNELFALLKEMHYRMQKQAESALRSRELQLTKMKQRLSEQQPDRRLAELARLTGEKKLRLMHAADALLKNAQTRLDRTGSRLHTAIDRRMSDAQNRLAQASVHLESISPIRVLDRGYAYVTDENRLIPDAASAATHYTMTIHFRDGQIDVRPLQEALHGHQEKNNL